MPAAAYVDPDREDRLALFLCGDDADARSVVAALVVGAGFAPIDAGPLSAAHLQEPAGGPIHRADQRATGPATGAHMMCAVVGVGPGLGSAIARRFAAEGYPVAMVARGWDGAEDLAEEIRGHGPAASAISADASDPAALTRALADARERLGPVRVLVYNAVRFTTGVPSTMPPEERRADFAINVAGALVAVQAVLPDMLAARQGVVLFTGGGAALYPQASWASLATTKAALRALAFALHDELTPTGIHVSTVTIEGTIGSSPRFQAATIADSYAALAAQPPTEWAAELRYQEQ